MRHFVIDTDTGSDDAVALILALGHPSVQVEAVTIVAGNVPMKQAAQNALYTIELCQANIPVYEGLDKPLLRPLQTAQHVHGIDGMGDVGLPLYGRRPAVGHAVNKLLETVRAFPYQIELVTLGPLSNLALALLLDPDIARLIKHTYIMGGTSDNFGNIGLVGEYNIWADPEAAKIVFESDMPLTMIGWDISRKYAVFAPDDIAILKAFDTPVSQFCIQIQATLERFAIEQTGLAGFDLPDPIAMAIALDNEIITSSNDYFVAVETSDGYCRGQTILDYRGKLGRRANTRVVLEAARQRFISLLHTSLGAFS